MSTPSNKTDREVAEEFQAAQLAAKRKPVDAVDSLVMKLELSRAAAHTDIAERLIAKCEECEQLQSWQPVKFVPDEQGGHLFFEGKIWRPA